MNKILIEQLVGEFGTPLLVMDHAQITKNYKEFKRKLPRVKPYFAVKSNPEPEIIQTIYDLGGGFDVASLPEFKLVADRIKNLLPEDQQEFIWNKLIYANTVKKIDSLHELNLYKPLLTYDSLEEMEKIKKHCPDAGLLLRIKVPNNGSVVELSNKFGIDPKYAVDLIAKTLKAKIQVEGISFHVGSQCNNFDNFIVALNIVNDIFKKCDKKKIIIGESVSKGYPVKVLDIGGGFPVKYHDSDASFDELAKKLNQELNNLFPKDKVDIIAEPGRFMVATAGTSIARVILAKHIWHDKPYYHIDDGIYHTYSAIMFDHLIPKLESLKYGKEKRSVVLGPTCDGLDEISREAMLPKLREGDLIIAKNMGAYTNASTTGNQYKEGFNGYPPAKVIHINL